VWVVNQANSQKIKNLNQKQKPQPPRAQMPGGQMQGRPMPGGPQRGAMPQGQRPAVQGQQGFGGQAAQQAARGPQDPEKAIEEFLRRAAHQQQGQQRPMPGRAPAPPAFQQPAVQEPAIQQLAKEGVWGDEPSEGVAAYENTQGVAAHVREAMDPGRFRPTDLTDLDEVDEQLEERLHATFDHQVGTFAASSSSVAAPLGGSSAAPTVTRRAISAAAAGVAAMITDRRQLTNAIILQDILRRPEM